MLIKKLKQIIQTASILGFIWGANVVAAPVEPFYFQGATNQQDMWDSLMRYKMFGQTGINFGNQDINVTDKVGWFGTNNGDLTLANDKHVVGGPILIGGNIILGTGILDFTTGPVRVTGRIDSKDGKSDGFANGPNFANGVHCVQGSVFDKYDQAILGDKYIGSSNYRNCPEDVPGINPNLKIPTVSQPDKNKMNIKNDLLLNSEGEKVIEIPVRKSGEPEIYDIYVPNGISLKNGASIIIKMPEGGRLTRIFSESIIFDGGSSIRVQHGNKILEKEDYAGDLLFYINSTISFAALHSEDKLQGSFISTDTIKIMQHMDLAGQLIAKYLTIDAHFEGDGFRYVPFDPPILEINREALAYGSFFEGSEWQEVPIKLDSIPRTDVIFNYCFEFTSNKAAADSADFFENAKGMPICGRDSGEVTILEGKTKPEGKNIVSIYPILDAKPEGLEYFNIKIFNIYGAVLPGNKKSDFFELSINDANPIPQDASVTGEEDKNLYFSSKNFPYTTTDTSGEDTLEVLKIISLPSKGSLYINGDTVKVNQEILAKDIDSLYFLGEKDEFGSPYTSFKFNVQTKWGTGEKPATMTVNLTAVNDAPTIAAGQSFNIEENKSVNSTVGTVKAIDVDGDTLTFKVLGFTALKADSTADTITVDYFNFNSSGLITTKVVLDFETMPHLYRYQVEVSDGELTDTAFVYINLLDVNEAPIVKNAEFDIEENDNPNKVLGSIEASDVDAADTVLSYSISGEDSQYFKIDAKTGQLSVNNTVFDYEDSIPNVFTFSVIVTDNVLGGAKSTLSDTATVTVTVLDVNDAPTVEGAEFEIEENNNPNLILDTIKASDVDSGTVLTYSISGEGSEHFVIDATTGQLSVNNTVFDYEDSKPNVFTFTVTVTDNGLQGKGPSLSATASIKITIIDTPEPPKFTQDKYEFDVEEEHGNNVLVGQVEATDEDTEKSKLTYKILSSIVTNEGKLVDYFVIDSKTGEIRVKPGLILDYETHDHFYSLKVSVSDGALFDTTTVLIELIDINEAPIVKGAEFEIEENNNPNLILDTIEASDVDAGTVLTYSISGEGSEHFVIDATTGQLSVNNTVFDYEDSKPNEFTFTVTVTDNGLQGKGPSLSATASIKITIIDTPEAPKFTQDKYEFDVEEEHEKNVLVGQVEATDEDTEKSKLTYKILSSIVTNEGKLVDYFVIDSKTGQIRVKPDLILDYETHDHFYSLKVSVSDGALFDTTTVLIELIDINEAPIVKGAEFEIDENNNPNLNLGKIEASDVDAGTVLTYSISGEGSEYFVIDATTGQLSVNNTVFDYEDSKPNVFTFTVTVTDNGLQGKGSSLSDTASIKITIIDIPEAPKFTQDKYEFDVEEEHENNVLVGQVEATDEDTKDSELTYKILSSIVTNEGKLVDYFMIDSKTGEIRVKPSLILDYETHDHFYTLKVSVSDGVLFDTTTVLIELIDINEAPIVKGAEFEIDENNNPNLILDIIKASDVDAGTVLTYSISGEGSEYFVIDATTGQLSVNNTVFDYEDSKPNVFTFTVTVTDNGLQGKGPSLSDTASIKITIIDIPEAPKFTQDKYEFDVEEEHEKNVLVGQVEATDEDTEKSKLTYSIISSKAVEKSVNHFVIDPKTGEIRVKPGLILDYETHDHFYTLKVSVSDGALFDTTTVLIELIDINEAPIVKNVEFTINENNEANDTLGTIKASDVDAGTVLTYSISGEGSEHFVIDATTGQLSVNNTVFDYEDSKPNVFTFTVTVTDNGLQGEGDFLSTSAIVKVTVKDVNEAPELADVTFDVDENSPAGTVVGLLEAFDPDANDVLKYSILEGNTGSIFVLNATTGLITVRNSNSLNYEEMENHKFELIVRVVDKGGLADTAKVTIVVNDINDAPVIAAGQKFEIFENNKNEAIVGEIHVSDEDGDVLTFDFLSLNAGTKAVDYFDLYTDGTIRVKSGLQLDYETMPHVYELKFSVSDGDTTITGSVAIHLLDLNEAPVVDDQNFGIEENSPAGALVGVIQASDPDKVASFNTLSYKVLSGNEAELFVIDSKTGKITVRKSNSLDYETMPHLYLLTVEVSDGELQDTATISIDLLDVNDPPTVEDLETNIDENVPYGTVIDTVIAHDEDTPDLEYSFVKDPASESFSIDNNGVITVNGPLDYETRNEYIVKVVVFDGDSRDTALVIIRINNVNEAPVIENQAFSAKEDISSKHRIGVVQYKDPENDPLVFTIIQDTSSLFRITPSGEIYLKDGASLDYEKTTEYVIQVKGVDPGGLMDSAYVTINVLDVFEKTEVEIVVVVTTDSIHSYPDTVYTNSSYVELEWDVDGNRFYGDTLLEKGKNVIIKKYCDLSKNECGLDTVVIFYSNESPKVDLSLKVGEKEKVSGVTIVEEKDKKDSLNYINKEKNQLVVTVKDPSPDGGTTVNRFEIEAQLKTINVPSSVFDDLSVISKNWQFEPKKEKVEITVDGRTKLKYETKVKGYSVTVVYDPAKDSSTAKVIYTAIVNGEKVEVSFKADRDTGKLIKDDGGSYAVTYSYKDKRNNTMLISYPVNSSGKVVKTKEEGGVIYTVGYSYTNAYGNTAIQSTKILLDTIPPVVQIIDPVEGVTISSVSVDVKWTVDGIVQDTLNLQGLEKGVNRIIRAYRDKAGNETADTVYVIMKGAKDIVVKIENPMIEITKKKLDQFKDGLDDDALYRVSILNPSTNLEQELIVGTKGGNKKGSNDEPYPYLSGSHLGPTLEIDVKMPSLNPTGGLASLADLVESDGMIALESGGGWDRKKVTVQEYVSSYCSAEFQKDFDINDPSATPLYKVDFGMSVWVYTSLGSFVEKYTVNPKINSRELVNVAGVAKLFFEVVPNRDGVLIDKRGRLWGTGAYLYKTDIKMHFEQQCALPSSKMGSKRKTEDQTLSSFGYKRIPIK